MKRVTLKEIATEVGCSAMTVSCALRNSPKVLPATREKILAVATRLGYRPDPELTKLMQHLRQPDLHSFSHNLAFINSWPDPNEHTKGYIGQLFTGAQNRAAQLGFNLETFWLKERGMTARRLSTILYNRGIRGILLPPWHHPEEIPALDWSRFSVVAATLSIIRPPINRVVPHIFHNTVMAFDELLRLGYRRIGYLETQDSFERSEQLARGAFEMMRATRIPDPVVPALTLKDDHDSALEAWFDRYRPDAIVSPHAFGHRRLKKSRGISVKNCGYIVLDALQNDSLTAIDQMPGNLGSAAVDLLFSQILRNESGIPENPKLVSLGGRLRPGSSTRRVAPLRRG